MLYLNLQRILSQRGITSPNQLLIKYGFTPFTASRILNNKAAGLSNAQLEKLCLALRCTPNDLYAWEKPVDESVAKDHPLHALVPKPQRLDMVQQLRELPLDKLEQVRQFIEALPKE